MEYDWVFCTLLSLVYFETVDEIVYLSGAPVSHVEYLCSSVSFVWDFVAALVCAVFWRFVFTCRFCTFVSCQDVVLRQNYNRT
jgi:hypothetical protein